MDRGLTKILVVHPGALGDTLLALPVLDALKTRFAPASLHLLGHPSLVHLLPGRSVVDAMISVEGYEYTEFYRGLAMAPAANRFFRQFQIVVVWATDPDGHLHETLSALGIPRIVVCSPGLREPDRRHATARFQGTVSAWLGSVPVSLSRVSCTERDRAIGLDWLHRHRGADARPMVAVHPGSGSCRKCWWPERFAAVSRGLLEDGVDVLLLEGPAEVELTAELERHLQPLQPLRLRHASLPTVLGVLAHCSTFLGNDSGLTHLVAATGLSTVAIFGPTDPAVWGPRGDRVINLRGDLCDCASATAQEDCIQRRCLSVSTDVVLRTLRHLLSETHAALPRDPALC
jgi:ADP-heptose:LPS heptosyltransferase